MCDWDVYVERFFTLEHDNGACRLCELVVHNDKDVLTLIEQGGAVRKVASTNMNERSSRSHSCFTIKVHLASRKATVRGTVFLSPVTS